MISTEIATANTIVVSLKILTLLENFDNSLSDIKLMIKLILDPKAIKLIFDLLISLVCKSLFYPLFYL